MIDPAPTPTRRLLEVFDRCDITIRRPECGPYAGDRNAIEFEFQPRTGAKPLVLGLVFDGTEPQGMRERVVEDMIRRAADKVVG